MPQRTQRTNGGWGHRLYRLSVWLLTAGLGGCAGLVPSKPEVEKNAAALEAAHRSTDAVVEVEDRGWSEQIVYYQNGGIKHHSLYLEDPYENQGGHDGGFATWGKNDAWAMAGGPAQFLVNIVLLPMELVRRPPWQEQQSRSIMADEGPMYEFGSLPSGNIRESGYPGHPR